MFKSKKINAFIEKHKLKPKFYFVRWADDPIATVCVLQEGDEDALRIGISMLHPIEKSFNKERGRAIALGRAFHCFIRDGKSRKMDLIRGIPMFLFSPSKGKLIPNQETPFTRKKVGNNLRLRWARVQREAMKFYDSIFWNRQRVKQHEQAKRKLMMQE